MDKMKVYQKTFYAALAAVSTTLSLAWDGVSQAEAIALVTTWGGVLAVFFFPNTPVDN